MSDILCVTNRALCGEDFLLRLERIAAAKPAGIILREKDLSEADYKDLAARVLDLCKAQQVPCILHTFVDAALDLGADAIHLPLPVLRAMPDGKKAQFSILGASCHSVEDALEAQALGCTYLTAGHIFATDCKRGLPGRGLDFLEAVCKRVSIPVYAIGGIRPETIAPVRAAGASGACVMSSLMQCEDPGAFLNKFEKRVESMAINKERLRLYAVTNRAWVGRQTLLEQIEDALIGGVTIVQLREKNLDEAAFVAEAIQVRDLCHKYHVPLIINDNVDVALKSGADGVHVGIEDAPVAEIRSRVPAGFIIGATCKTVEQAKAAEQAGADYMGVGAVFPSPTKKNAIRITNEQLKEICSAVSIPAVAIGGISRDNVLQLKGGGMDGIAVVSAIFGAADIHTAAAELKKKANAIVG